MEILIILLKPQFEVGGIERAIGVCNRIAPAQAVCLKSHGADQDIPDGVKALLKTE